MNDTTTMKPQEINRRIAEACGWRPSKKGDWWNSPEGNQAFENELPNYHGDLNAIHEAMVCLGWEELNEFVEHLQEIVEEAFSVAYIATAAQRAEAFLRTLGKWEDGE